MEPDKAKRQPPQLSGGRLKWAIIIVVVVGVLLYILSDLIGGFGLLG